MVMLVFRGINTLRYSKWILELTGSNMDEHGCAIGSLAGIPGNQRFQIMKSFHPTEKHWRRRDSYVDRYLEDHPRTRKWLITMVIKSPKWGCGTPSKWPK